MGNGLAALLALFLCHLAVPSPARAQVPAKPTTKPLIAASERAYPPFCIVEKNGEVTGFANELLRAALKAMGRSVTFRTGTWTQVKGQLESGEIQALPLVGRTPEREAHLDFTFPYMSTHGAIVIRKNQKGIHFFEDLRGRSVVVMENDSAHEFLRRSGQPMTIHTTPTFREAFRQLSGGRHDAVIVQRLVALRLIKSMGISNLRVVSAPIKGFRQEFCFAVKEGDKETLSLLNEGLALVIADGTFRRLHAKWFAALELPTARTIVVGGDHNYPPFEYLDEDGRPTGYNVELTRAIARELNLAIRIRLGPWQQIKARLLRGEIDIIQGMLYSPARDITFDFSQAHMVNHYVGVVVKGKKPPVTVQDLKGLRLVVLRGDIMHEFVLEHRLSGGKLTVVDSPAEAMRAVASGQQDCALIPRLTALFLMNKKKWTNLSVGKNSLLAPEYGYAAMPGKHALLATFSEGLKILEKTGEYRRIQKKWMGVYQEEKRGKWSILRPLAMVLIPLLLVLLLFFLWTWSLRHQVAKQTRILTAQDQTISETTLTLSQQAQFQRAMITCSPLALYSIDLEGRVKTWNSTAEKIFGWTESEVVGEPLPFIPGDQVAEAEEIRARAEAGTNVVAIEVTRLHKDGHEIPISLSVAPILNDFGRTVGIMSSAEDITEKKAAREQRERLEDQLLVSRKMESIGRLAG
ncbi:transporter substrate-binding domain-containing protein, partial [Myxococcota bacterium]|nr:transporter substrate-binding domain-containing protein [Myxococcota bacterium]